MKALLAEFRQAGTILDSARRVRQQGYPLLDALTPYPLPELAELVGAPPPRLRVPMAVFGLGVAFAFFGLESWSAVYAYPVNEGGRPLFSWPVFLLSPFEVGVLSAAVAGCAALLIGCGLPRLNHPLFDSPLLGRASQDRFVLVVDPLDADRLPRLRALLFDLSAMAVSEADT